MAALNEYDLLVLEIALGNHRRDESGVELELQFWNAGQVEPVRDWTLSASRFGLKDVLDRSDTYGRTELSIPPEFADGLQAAIAQRLPGHPNRPLWLKFVRPAGYLGLVRWERLSPALNRPLCRLPEYFLSTPVQNHSRLNIALCASMPRAKASFPVQGYLLDTLRCLRENAGRSTDFHIFVDEGVYREIQSDPLVQSSPEVKIYPPGNADEFGQLSSTSRIPVPSGLGNPWLQWMQYELRNVSLDAVCFVAHGYFAEDRGAIALAETPTVNADRHWARFVGSRELSHFMTLTGAWSAILLSPWNNFSQVGLYGLADELACLRPGTVLLHDVAMDEELIALARAARFAFNRNPSDNPASDPATVIYTRPYPAASPAKSVEVSYPRPVEVMLESVIDAHEIQSAIQEPGSLPAWAVNAERFLEKRTAQRYLRESSGPESASSRNTIRQIRDIIHRHSTRNPDEGSQ